MQINQLVETLTSSFGFAVVREASTGYRLQRAGQDWSIFLTRSGRIDFTGIESPAMTVLEKQPTALVKCCVKGAEQFKAAMAEIESGTCNRITSAGRGRKASGELAGW